MTPARVTRKKSALRGKMSRAQHSDLLRRLAKRRPNPAAWSPAPGQAAGEDPAEPGPEPGRRPLAAPKTVLPAAGAAPEPEKIVHRGRHAVTVETTLNFSRGGDGPSISLALRLTTALRGQRRQNGVEEAAYLLRLELLQGTPGVKLEGFSLGPWQADGLNLEPGSILVPEPIWAGFAPGLQTTRGRVLLADGSRNRLLDLPWRVTAVVPGTEPLAG